MKDRLGSSEINATSQKVALMSVGLREALEEKRI
jgi:hypothetical protein